MKRTPLKRRTPLRAKKGLKRGGPLKRKTPLKAKGGSRFPKRRNVDYTDWVASLPCLLQQTPANTGCWYPPERIALGRYADPAHINSTRGSGAYDEGQVVNLCRAHHIEQEGRTKRFNTKYAVDLATVAQQLWARYEQEQLGHGI